MPRRNKRNASLASARKVRAALTYAWGRGALRDDENNITVAQALQLCAHYSPQQGPSVVRQHSSTHYNANVLSNNRAWQSLVPALQAFAQRTTLPKPRVLKRHQSNR